MIPQHISSTVECYTPEPIVAATHRVLGGIDLDPASCKEANKTVGAKRIFALPKDGLAQQWRGRVFLNPPGGRFALSKEEAAAIGPTHVGAVKAKLNAEAKRWGTRSRAAAWWRKLVEEHREGRTKSAIFVGFTLEILRSTQGDPRWSSCGQHALCFPSERLEFDGKQPTHANVIVYLGEDKEFFREVFSKFGDVRL